jgi:CBS domain-containing protein
MTEKIARRGVRTPAEYSADALDQVLVRTIATAKVVVFKEDDRLSEARRWLASGAEGSSHQGFPIVNAAGVLRGVLTRRDLLDPAADESKTLKDLIVRSIKYVYDDCSVREAADHMVHHAVGRLPVVSRSEPNKLVGVITRSDVLSAYRGSLDETKREEPTIVLPLRKRPPGVKRA